MGNPPAAIIIARYFSSDFLLSSFHTNVADTVLVLMPRIRIGISPRPRLMILPFRMVAGCNLVH